MPDEPRPLAWVALGARRIEAKAKIVIKDDDFVRAIDLTEQQKRDYAIIVGLIQAGGDLLPYYRRSTTADWLLRNHQVLHLHLGGPGSNAILYVVQYPEHVLLLRVDTHIHLDDIPPGKRLPIRGRAKFQSRLQAAKATEERALQTARERLLGKRKPKQ